MERKRFHRLTAIIHSDWESPFWDYASIIGRMQSNKCRSVVNVCVKQNLLMEEGAGFKIAMGAFDQTRPTVSNSTRLVFVRYFF